MAASRTPLRYHKGLKEPHSTLERISKRVLPRFAHQFLLSQPPEYPTARFFLGALFGAVGGAGLFLGLYHNLPMSSEHRLLSGYAFVAVCVLGGAFSSYVRCSVLLMFPSMLGGRGRSYITLLCLYGLYSGPISNIQRNVQDVSFSLGCNMDLQIRHSRVMWRVVMEPFVQVLQDMVDDNREFQEEARNLSQTFQNLRDEVLGRYGYDSLEKQPGTAGNSTQDLFTAKTRMRCDYVVEEGVGRCRRWFQVKWQECMDAIKAPLINHILCVSMRFHFLCDVMRVMTPWCKEHIPVEGNFGQTFDKLSFSIDKLSREFHTSVVLQESEQQSVLGESVLLEELSRALQESREVMEPLLELLQLILCFTFISIFTSAFGYARQYRRDVRFDNVYITTYFKQIDARRRRAGKRYLLPLKKAEQGHFINPLSLALHPRELKLVISGLLQVLCLGVFMIVLFAVDMILYHIFDIIRKHTYTEFSHTSSHHIDITVGGQSMMAKLLRKTIGAFNTSSNLDMQSTNQHCLPQPSALATEDYLRSTAPLLMMVLMCCLQAYSNRLRRVIAAFYFPKREKRRVLFLYNLQIQRRICYMDRQRRRLSRLGRSQEPVLCGALSSVLERLFCGLRWCCVCGARQGVGRAVQCPAPGCPAVYCPQCWRDLGRVCYACRRPPDSVHHPADSCSDNDVHYVG